MEEKYSDMSVVTEIGVFGSLNIEDPTTAKVKKKNANLSEEEMEQLIQESIQNNANI